MSSPLSASSRAPATDQPATAPVTAPDVSVIIVNYNVCEFLEQALRSVERASQGLVVEVFVVDNNSVDGSAELVRRDFPEVRLIVNDRNVGFSRANNQAIREASGRHILILNPDTILQENTIQVLVDHLDSNRDAGAVGCQILNPDGSFAPESRRAFPTPLVAFYRIIGLSRIFPRSRTFGRYNMTYLPRDRQAEVDALSGSCMMVRRAALQWSRSEYAEQSRAASGLANERNVATGGRAAVGGAEGRGHLPRESESKRSDPARNGAHGPGQGHGAGLLDESFFMYGEDLDWCYRIQEAGWKILYTPATQIIHYKGESTKKGELRYVRLFYGAMLLFIEKHFQNRYSRFFAFLLRLGIMLRAVFTVLSKAVRKLHVPLVDFALVYVSVITLGVLRSWEADASLHESFLYTVAPAFGIAVVAGIASAGGYRRNNRHVVRPVLAGAVVGLLTVAAASFFLKDIAFSRAVVGLSGALVIPVLLLHRMLRRNPSPDRRRAIVVGSASEAERLQRMISRHPAPPFLLEGYVGPDQSSGQHTESTVPRLGSVNQLRDLARLRRIDDVVFAAKGVPHADTFAMIQQLRDLPLQFRMLMEGRQHVIGKASVEDLSLPALVELEQLGDSSRSYVSRRVFELLVCIPALLSYPLLYVSASLTPADSLLRRLLGRVRLLPDVLAGRRALVGFADMRVPDELVAAGIEPGVFSVAESWPHMERDADTLMKAYLFYARHQSAALDCGIMLRSLRNRR